MKGSINIKNKDNEYFRWCLIRYLNPVNKRANIRNVEDKFAKQLNFKGMQFPVHKKRLRKNKKTTQYFHVFGSEDEATYHIFQNKLLKTY